MTHLNVHIRRVQLHVADWWVRKVRYGKMKMHENGLRLLWRGSWFLNVTHEQTTHTLSYSAYFHFISMVARNRWPHSLSVLRNIFLLILIQEPNHIIVYDEANSMPIHWLGSISFEYISFENSNECHFIAHLLDYVDMGEIVHVSSLSIFFFSAQPLLILLRSAQQW